MMIRDAFYALAGVFMLVVLVIAAWADRGKSAEELWGTKNGKAPPGPKPQASPAPPPPKWVPAAEELRRRHE